MASPASTNSAAPAATPARIDRLRGALASWYRTRRQAYAWRGIGQDPYRVLVSEVMLQQTQASRVEPIYRAFLERFPDVARLALAGRGDVIRAWARLGYNRRAVALSEAARIVVAEHEGRVPRDPAVLVRLPGVGPYTAAAVASIAYGVVVPAIDVNVARVVARVILGREPVESRSGDAGSAAEAAAAEAAAWIDPEAPGDWNQALMDLGREVCRPVPRCETCPLLTDCRFARSGVLPGRASVAGEPFSGSNRQVRGAVVGELRRGPRTLGRLSNATGFSLARVAGVLAGLQSDGLVRADVAALQGRPRGRVALFESPR